VVRIFPRPSDQRGAGSATLGGPEAAGAHAVAAGAALAEFQPQDDVRVYLGPAGHPFCLFRPD
jgi:hypothetical protein